MSHARPGQRARAAGPRGAPQGRRHTHGASRTAAFSGTLHVPRHAPARHRHAASRRFYQTNQIRGSAWMRGACGWQGGGWRWTPRSDGRGLGSTCSRGRPLWQAAPLPSPPAAPFASGACRRRRGSGSPAPGPPPRTPASPAPPAAPPPSHSVTAPGRPGTEPPRYGRLSILPPDQV